jgi:hypothetical protein
MNEDLMKMVEQVAAQAEQNQNRQGIEAYINRCVADVARDARSYLATSNTGIPEPTYTYLENWQVRNRDRLSLQIGEVVRIILRRELLGE